MSGHSPLIEQLRELHEALAAAGIAHAAIGGLAVNCHGFVRATHDIDFLIAIEDEDRLPALMASLGYECIDRRPDLSSYVRELQRADFLHARRDASRGFLREAHIVEYAGIPLPIVGPEALLAFKVQAFTDDPSRLRDLADMIEIVDANRDTLDYGRLRGYFALFDREKLLDELVRAVDRRRAGGAAGDAKPA